MTRIRLLCHVLEVHLPELDLLLVLSRKPCIALGTGRQGHRVHIDVDVQPVDQNQKKNGSSTLTLDMPKQRLTLQTPRRASRLPEAPSYVCPEIVDFKYWILLHDSVQAGLILVCSCFICDCHGVTFAIITALNNYIWCLGCFSSRRWVFIIFSLA